MNDILILDTDAASVLAKSSLVNDVLKLFSKIEVAITPKVENEIEVPFSYGYNFPKKILDEDRIDIAHISKDERKLYRKWLDQTMIGKGELESIAVAKMRDGTFFTMDKIAVKFAKDKEVDTIAFNTIMKNMLKNNIIDRKEAEKAIEKIEKKDNRKLDKSKIFSE